MLLQPCCRWCLEQVPLGSGVPELAEFFSERSLAGIFEDYVGRLLLAHYPFFLWVLDSVLCLFLYCFVFEDVAPMVPSCLVFIRRSKLNRSVGPRLLLTILAGCICVLSGWWSRCPRTLLILWSKSPSLLLILKGISLLEILAAFAVLK